jgi:hypothetical protein
MHADKLTGHLGCTNWQIQYHAHAIITLTAVLLLLLHDLPALSGLSLQGRKVAVFGCGDQHGYGDYFCDAMEELHSSFAAAGADMVGAWPTDGYEHSESKVRGWLSWCCPAGVLLCACSW